MSAVLTQMVHRSKSGGVHRERHFWKAMWVSRIGLIKSRRSQKMASRLSLIQICSNESLSFTVDLIPFSKDVDHWLTSLTSN